MFITFEGGEGAGKSTQVRRLVARLEQAGRQVVATREPGGSPKAEALRSLLLGGAVQPFGADAEAILFAAARIDHVTTRIRPALNSGAIVVCDRFIDSTRAYQGALGHVSPALLKVLESVAAGATRPDLTLILDLPPEQGLARAASRAGATHKVDRFEAESLLFHQRLRDAFLTIARKEPLRCRAIDASGSVEEIEEAIWGVVSERLSGVVA